MRPTLLAGLLAAFAPFSAAAQAPANDGFSGAEDVLARRGLARFERVSTVGATRSATLPCTAGANDDDVFFTFAAAGPGLRLEYRDLDATTADAGVGYAVYDLDTDELLGCSYRIASGRAGAAFVDLSRALTLGHTYAIALFTSAPGGGVFDFRLTEHDFPRIASNPGDDCVSVTVDVDGSGGRVEALAPDGTLLLSLGNDEALGRTTVTLRGHRGEAPRTSPSGLIYDRNVAVVPSRAPTEPVRVDFYVTTAEFLRLAGASERGTAFAAYNLVSVPGSTCSPGYGGGGSALALTRAFDYPGGYRIAAELTTLGELFVVPSAAPLPVELLSFSARAVGDENVVEWRVANEVDLAAYVLERSGEPDAGDPDAAATWETVAEVIPRGADADAAIDYATTDGDPLRTSYYRLRQVDVDGSEATSPTVVVERGGAAEALALYPNPSSPGTAVTLSLPAELATASVIVRDATGREVLRRRVGGRRTLTLATGALSAGLYHVDVQTDTEVHTERLVVQ